MSARSASLPLFAAESPVYAMRGMFPLTVGGDGRVILPGEVRWALGLNPGDLLLTEWDEALRDQLMFRSYAETLRSAVDAFSRPWPWVERLLATPMAAVAPGGGLMLPQAGAVLLGNQPGMRQTLQARVGGGQRWFTVKQAGKRQAAEEMFLEARHTLPVEPGFRVTLPEDVLWALALAEGDILSCETRLTLAELHPLAGRPAGPRRVIEIEPGGKLALTTAARGLALLQPGADHPEGEAVDVRREPGPGSSGSGLTPPDPVCISP